MVGTANNGRMRHAFSVVNSEEVGLNSAPPSNAGIRERCENMMDYIKRLRLCIKWFQELEGGYLFEQEKLQNALDFTESKCVEMDLILKNKEEELNLIIVELRKSLASLQEKLSKEKSEKLAALNSLAKEKEGQTYLLTKG
ncbi:hypothetical protein OIU84_003097 [Salix udensis]|uniref:Uncharacterized protein n=1 Tax=Salix udensis TaxID=889485 RepID=A0AAD6P5F1_9ROSI|nr:hypothetical protein OIU84_003097 [Salix udensis]